MWVDVMSYAWNVLVVSGAIWLAMALALALSLATMNEMGGQGTDGGKEKREGGVDVGIKQAVAVLCRHIYRIYNSSKFPSYVPFRFSA